MREKIGVMYGNPETTTGGRALKFYSSVRLDVRKIGQPIKVGNDAVANTVKVKTVKNKVAAPFKEVELALVYGKGFDQLNDLVTLAADMDIIKKAGSFYSYGEDRIGQGKEKAMAYIAERPELEDEIRARVLAAIRSGNQGDSAPAAAGDASEVSPADTDAEQAEA